MQSLDFMKDLSKSELDSIIGYAKKLKARIRPITIRVVYKKCGKADCTCSYGSLEEYGHGPYLVASYTSDGKQRQRSLGKECDQQFFISLATAPAPPWYKFAVTGKQKKAMSRERQWDVVERSLTSWEFAAFHGVEKDASAMDRIERMEYDTAEHELAMRDWRAGQDVSANEFMACGVGKYGAVLWLRSMVEKGYYVSTCR